MTNILTNRSFQIAAALGLVVLAGFAYQNFSGDDTEATTTANVEQAATTPEETTAASNTQQKAEVEAADAAIMNAENTENTENTEKPMVFAPGSRPGSAQKNRKHRRHRKNNGFCSRVPNTFF